MYYNQLFMCAYLHSVCNFALECRFLHLGPNYSNPTKYSIELDLLWIKQILSIVTVFIIVKESIAKPPRATEIDNWMGTEGVQGLTGPVSAVAQHIFYKHLKQLYSLAYSKYKGPLQLTKLYEESIVTVFILVYNSSYGLINNNFKRWCVPHSLTSARKKAHNPSIGVFWVWLINRKILIRRH